jgi:hypothetical protein
MSWKIECGRGWKSLYAPLLERCRIDGVEVVAVDERLGALRIRVVKGWSEDLKAMILAAEAKSLLLCEICGLPAVTRSDSSDPKRRSGWIRTRCDAHVFEIVPR